MRYGFRVNILWVACLLVLAVPVVAAEQTFDQCVTELQIKARADGLPAHLVDDVLAKVSFVPRVIELDQRQPEFTETFANYLGRRVTDTRINRGRELLAEYRPFLQQLTREYGIPPQYLVAFWGLETNFGAYLGKMRTLDSLATLACDPRRSRYFTAELLHALHIIDAEKIDPAKMEGSWAGAMGHTQFMPSAYRQHAVDGDGDGTIDLWQSPRDALASGANFLNKLGWERGLRWGREVGLPDNFPYDVAGRNQAKPLSYWRDLGVTRPDGSALPTGNPNLEAALLVPAGHRGPAFLVYHNFNVIMGWNRSEFYALSVGHLADRINGAGGLYQAPPEDAPRLTREQIELLQTRLNTLGFEAGEADGILGPGTRAAISRFQKFRDMVADGYPDPGVFRALDISLNGE